MSKSATKSASAALRSHAVIEIKSFGDDGEGTFSGCLSAYGVVDEGKDMVLSGAFKKTIADNNGSVPCLWAHDDMQPIGTLELIDTPQGLNVKGRLLIEGVPKAKEVYCLIKNKVVKGLSIGYQALKKEFKDGVRHISEARLFEGSIVVFPMNLEAQISAVKSAGERQAKYYGDIADGNTTEFAEDMDELQTACMGGDIIRTMGDRLYNCWWEAGYDPDGDLAEDMPAILAYAEATFDAAKEAFLAALAKYGNMSAAGDADQMKMLRTKARLQFVQHKGLAVIESKAKTKRVAGEDLSASAFLIVGDAEDTSTWKLPVKFSTDAKTKSHIRNALARIDQVQGVSADDLAKAKKKLLSLAKEHGIDAAKSEDFAALELELAGATEAPPPAIDPVAPVAPVAEAKAGRKVSADTAGALKNAHDMMKSAGNILEALYVDDPLETSSDSTAAAAETKTEEPAQDHSTGIGDVLQMFSRLTDRAA